MHYTPACWVIKQFGGVRPLARAIGRSPGNVAEWRKGRTATDRAGEIPARQMSRILELARSRMVDVTAEDLINGREVPEVQPA